MTISEFKNIVWNHYLLIEKDFISTFQYVSLDQKNYGVFSDKYFSLLQLVGSEVDVILKEICVFFPPIPGNHLSNINEYRDIIITNLPSFPTEGIWVAPINVVVNPWTTWGLTAASNPIWWDSYNKTKHNRTSIINGNLCFEKANLENVLNALAALYYCDLLLYTELLRTSNGLSDYEKAIEPSSLFEINSKPSRGSGYYSSMNLNGVDIHFMIK